MGDNQKISSFIDTISEIEHILPTHNSDCSHTHIHVHMEQKKKTDFLQTLLVKGLERIPKARPVSYPDASFIVTIYHFNWASCSFLSINAHQHSNKKATQSETENSTWEEDQRDVNRSSWALLISKFEFGREGYIDSYFMLWGRRFWFYSFGHHLGLFQYNNIILLLNACKMRIGFLTIGGLLLVYKQTCKAILWTPNSDDGIMIQIHFLSHWVISFMHFSSVSKSSDFCPDLKTGPLLHYIY